VAGPQVKGQIRMKAKEGSGMPVLSMWRPGGACLSIISVSQAGLLIGSIWVSRVARLNYLHGRA